MAEANLIMLDDDQHFRLLETASGETRLAEVEVINDGEPTSFTLPMHTLDFLRTSMITIRVIMPDSLGDTVLTDSDDAFLMRHGVNQCSNYLFPRVGRNANQELTSYMIARGDPVSTRSLVAAARPTGVTTALYPAEVAAYMTEVDTQNPGPDPSLRDETYFVYGQIDDCTHVITTTGYPLTSRLCTAAYYAFPYAREHINRIATQVDYESFIAFYDTVTPRPLPHSDQGKAEFFQAGMIFSLLSGAYSNDDQVGEQVWRRYEAGCQSFGVKRMERAEFNAASGNLRRNTFKMTPVGLSTIGAILAINRDLEYDLTVTRNTLVPMEVLQTTYNLSNYSMALLEQLRLVYAFSQHTTIKFGFAIIDFVAAWFEGIGHRFRNDLDAARVAARDVRDSMYCGLTLQIPENHQVKAMARIAEVGLHYKGRLAAASMQGDQWGRYSVDSVSKHIDEQEDLAMCLTIAGMLPIGRIVSLAMLAPYMSIADLNVQLAAEPPISELAFYTYLKKQNITCTWSNDYLRRVRIIKLNEIEATRMARIRIEVEDNITRIRSQMPLDLTREEEARRNARITAAGRTVIGILMGQFSAARNTLEEPDLEGHAIIQTLVATLNRVSTNLSTSSWETLEDATHAGP